MLPYIYTAAKECTDTALSICRPMYYDYPNNDEAFAFSSQYMFGPDILISPITDPRAQGSDFVEASIWLPEGEWFDVSAGRLVSGDTVLRRGFLLDEVPCFVKAGAIIPGQFDCRRAPQGSFEKLLFTVYPGPSCTAVFYEDDGQSYGYERGEGATIRATTDRGTTAFTFTVRKESGGFPGFVAQRRLRLKVVAEQPPASVSVDGRALAYRCDKAPGSWWYDGDSATIVIDAGECDIESGVTVRISLETSESRRRIPGFAGDLRRIKVAFNHARLLELEWERILGNLAMSGERICRDPSTFERGMERFYREVKTLPSSSIEARRQLADAPVFKDLKEQALDRALRVIDEIL